MNQWTNEPWYNCIMSIYDKCHWNPHKILCLCHEVKHTFIVFHLNSASVFVFKIVWIEKHKLYYTSFVSELANLTIFLYFSMSVIHWVGGEVEIASPIDSYQWIFVNFYDYIFNRARLIRNSMIQVHRIWNWNNFHSTYVIQSVYTHNLQFRKEQLSWRNEPYTQLKQDINRAVDIILEIQDKHLLPSKMYNFPHKAFSILLSH